MENLHRLLADLAAFDLHLFTLGTTQVTLVGLIKLIVLIALLFYLTGRFSGWLTGHLLARTSLELPTRIAIGAIVRYLLLVLGFIVILQSAGINLTSLNVLAGAVGVGVGFGLQNIMSNFISGLIIMIERPIKVGDRVVVSSVEGEVMEIGARRTIVRTNDNETFIIPNQRFITENVINLHYFEARVRVLVKVKVAQGPDPRAIRTLMLEAADENPHVLQQPPPEVRLVSYGDGGAMSFELQAWNTDLIDSREQLISQLNFQIGDKFRANEIKIA